MPIIEVTDLPASLQSYELIDVLVAGVNAKAARVAPCLVAVTDEDAGTTAPTDDQLAEAQLVLIGAIKRWAEAGAGALQSQAAGPFSQTVDTRQRTGFNLWPSEIEQLQDICATGDTSTSAFSITLGGRTVHAPVCALYFGAAYCSCGADLTNFQYPLYEGGILSDDVY